MRKHRLMQKKRKDFRQSPGQTDPWTVVELNTD